MTDEYIKNKAIEYADDIRKWLGAPCKETRELAYEALIPLIKEVADKATKELQERIDKMKCCENCKHHAFYGNELCCKLRYDWESECLKTKEKWELAE